MDNGNAAECNGNLLQGDKAADPEAGRSAPRRSAVVCQVLRSAVVMAAKLGAVGVCAALVGYYMGWLFLLQLLLVALVAYLAAGGGFRWVYIVLRTLPRDILAVTRYMGLLWHVRSYQKLDLTVADIFRRQVTRHPDKTCFIFEEEEWTFQQVEDYSNRIGNVFLEHGYRKGDTVALFMENRPEFVCIWLGLSKLGVVVALVNYNLRLQPLVHSISVAGARALIFSAELAEDVREVSPELGSNMAFYRWSATSTNETSPLGEKNLTALIADAPATPPAAQEKTGYHDRLVYIYTSGTTGLPKAAVITNSRFTFIASGTGQMMGLRSSDRIYMPLPLYHTAGGAMCIGQALIRGSCVVIRKKFSASAYFADVIKYECTVGQYIGEMCRYILAVPPKPEDKEHNLRLMFGNGMRPQIWTQFVERFNIPKIAEFYGATEGNANIVNIDNKVGAIGFVSRIIPQVYPISIIRVDSASGEPLRDGKGLCIPCKAGEPGVFIGKINPNNPTRAFLGYVDKKASEKKIVYDVFAKGDAAFISGDLLVSDELGYLYFKDRTGDTFRWKGENVSTSEVEAVISNVAGYRDTVVYGVEIPGMEGRGGMAALLDNDDSLNLKTLAQGLKKSLPGYARPLFIRALRKVDMTGTYKLKKLDLQAEGFNPTHIKDKLFYLTAAGEYELLTQDIFTQIENGKLRL